MFPIAILLFATLNASNVVERGLLFSVSRKTVGVVPSDLDFATVGLDENMGGSEIRHDNSLMVSGNIILA